MREFRFSLTHILPYVDRIYDSVLIRENTGQWKPVFPHILCSACRKTFWSKCFLILISNTSWQPYFVLLNILVLCYYIKRTSPRRDFHPKCLKIYLPGPYPLLLLNTQMPLKSRTFFVDTLWEIELLSYKL